ncbi:MAG TPA: hypothetical protein VJ044_04520, partial [Candidatus Hodarchaeales archaeon]|nr:hypothetical protein [Candidatus Hodarchaeales archaeon]
RKTFLTDVSALTPLVKRDVIVAENLEMTVNLEANALKLNACETVFPAELNLATNVVKLNACEKDLKKVWVLIATVLKENICEINLTFPNIFVTVKFETKA